jgi:hypothetical protein
MKRYVRLVYDKSSYVLNGKALIRNASNGLWKKEKQTVHPFTFTLPSICPSTSKYIHVAHSHTFRLRGQGIVPWEDTYVETLRRRINVHPPRNALGSSEEYIARQAA